MNLWYLAEGIFTWYMLLEVSIGFERFHLHLKSFNTVGNIFFLF